MKKLLLFFTLSVGLTSVCSADIGLVAQDSIGLERKNDKTYILHQVDPSQTLYAISRRYGVEMNLIAQSNPAVNFTNLRVGQIIRVPYIPSNTVRRNNTYYGNNNSSNNQVSATSANNYNTAASNANAASTANSAASGKRQIGYMVKSGDSLYRISKRFGMSLERLKAINQLPGNSLQPGQVLLVEIARPSMSNSNASSNTMNNSEDIPSWAYNTAVEQNTDILQAVHTIQSDETLEQIAYRYRTTTQEIVKMNPTINFSQGMPVGRNILINMRYTPANNNSGNAATANSNNVSNNANRPSTISTVGNNGLPSNRKVTGIASRITGNTAMESNKHLALHATADEGTYIKVTNPNNGQYTLVKVVGRLGGSDARSNIVIKLSSAACKALGVIDKQFQVTLEYND